MYIDPVYTLFNSGLVFSAHFDTYMIQNGEQHKLYVVIFPAYKDDDHKANSITVKVGFY